MGLGHNYVTGHAIERVQLRWPSASALSDRDLVARIASSIESAERDKKAITTPGGTYVPFTLLGKDGFIIVRRGRVITVVGEEYCPEVCQIMNGV